MVHCVMGGCGWHDDMLMHNCEDKIRAFWTGRGQTPPDDAYPLGLDELMHLLEGKQA